MTDIDLTLLIVKPDRPIKFKLLLNILDTALGFRAKIAETHHQEPGQDESSNSTQVLRIYLSPIWQYTGTKADFLRGWLSARLPNIHVITLIHITPKDLPGYSPPLRSETIADTLRSTIDSESQASS